MSLSLILVKIVTFFGMIKKTAEAVTTACEAVKEVVRTTSETVKATAVTVSQIVQRTVTSVVESVKGFFGFLRRLRSAEAF